MMTVSQILDYDPLFIDTETTGFGKSREVVQIAIIGVNGDILFDSFIHPVDPIPDKTIDIHGITNDMVESAPSISDSWAEIEDYLLDRQIIIYNAAYDLRLLSQSADRFNDTFGKVEQFKYNTHCAMKLYREYANLKKPVSLAVAAKECGIVIPDGLHTAVVDAELTRKLTLYMAQEY